MTAPPVQPAPVHDGEASGAARATDVASAAVLGARRPLDLGQGGPIAASAGPATVGLGLPGIGQPLVPAFDEHHPPDAALVGDCVHCGFCLPTCPTYLLWGEEMDSPRGRIDIIGSGLGGAPLEPSAVRHLDQCLGCMACVTACPSGVQYDKLLEATRAQVERRTTRPAAMRSMRPRGLSISSPQSRYVGQVGRQNPQCTQSPTSAASGG